ncbi:MAG TPA: MerR family transcriptional regulator [Lentibacillus sp.]|uniref:MerR family transcriptional regulator n=1 Tax=Lentibacillus sp. TaxID=1925746 RepID=UPI002B4AFDB0|nr:MerR family transcriptional regulator [Lentibacillus sp.]HLR63572.1 MerR family transcriptional regulator [Lentibacillus sp.]
MEFLSIESLSHIVGVHKYTLKKWIQDFNVYVPKTKLNNVTYYRPDGVDVLKFIKQCKEQNYERQQIREILANSTFPIRLENIQDMSENTHNENDKVNMLTMMQTIGKIVSNVEDQQHLVGIIEEKQKNQNKLIKDIKKRTDEISHLKEEIETLKQQLASVTNHDLKRKVNQ